MTYDTAELDRRLRQNLKGNPFSGIFTGEWGTGKSTILAGVPVAAGKQRFVLDNEDSMRFLDAGETGADVYESRVQQFHMKRKPFASAEDLANLYKALRSPKSLETLGAIAIDNISAMQNMLIAHLLELCKQKKYGDVRAYCAVFAAPVPPMAYSDKALTSAYEGWMRNGKDQTVYQMVKAVIANLLLTCRKSDVHFAGASEQGILWKDYGKQTQEKLGDKPKVLGEWLRYTDCSIQLVRSAAEINSAQPPKGRVLPAQPKMRMQGLNPTWTMDWPGFIAELEAAAKRVNEKIPADKYVVIEDIKDESLEETPIPETVKEN